MNAKSQEALSFRRIRKWSLLRESDNVAPHLSFFPMLFCYTIAEFGAFPFAGWFFTKHFISVPPKMELFLE